MHTRMIRVITVSWVVLALLPGTTSAQTSATQGPAKYEPAEESGDVRRFRSPMVLQVPVEPFDSLLPKGWVVLEDMARYECDGVSLRKVKLRAKRLKSGSVALHVKGDTYTVEGEDKWVDLLFELVVAGDVVDSDLIKDVDAEESTERGVSAYLEVPGGKVAGQAQTVLKITVTVTEN